MKARTEARRGEIRPLATSVAFATHEAPTGEARARAGEKLESYLKKIDEQTTNVTDAESEAALQEALKSVRPGYREG